MSRLAIITFIDQRTGGDIDNTLPGGPVYPGGGPIMPPVDPGYGRPGGGWGGRPDNSLPGGGRPDNSLPWVPPPGQIVTLPVFPFDPTIDNSLPSSPGSPDNTLPGTTPPTTKPVPPPDASTKPIVPGRKFVVKWLACTGLILVPDNELPPEPPPVVTPQ